MRIPAHATGFSKQRRLFRVHSNYHSISMQTFFLSPCRYKLLSPSIKTSGISPDSLPNQTRFPFQTLTKLFGPTLEISPSQKSQESPIQKDDHNDLHRPGRAPSLSAWHKLVFIPTFPSPSSHGVRNAHWIPNRRTRLRGGNYCFLGEARQVEETCGESALRPRRPRGIGDGDGDDPCIPVLGYVVREEPRGQRGTSHLE